MKTTKRSKMLISSIAMLLVALVALGSATYAWYSIQRDVTADQMKVKAEAVGGLKISTDVVGAKVDATDITAENAASSQTPKYGAAVHFGMTSASVLYPAYIPSITSGVPTAYSYDHDGDGAATDVATNALGNAVTNVQGGRQYYVVKDVTIKNENEVTGRVTPTIDMGTGNPTASYIRADLYKADGTFVNSAISGTGESTNTKTAASTQYVDLAKNATQKYYVVIYADGYNANCTAANANNNTVNADINVTLRFHMVDA